MAVSERTDEGWEFLRGTLYEALLESHEQFECEPDVCEFCRIDREVKSHA